MVAYRVLRWLLRLTCRIFFRQIEVVGREHVPSGPVIFAGNHPNSLIDPALLIAYSGRIVRFAAKDVLFRSRLLRWVLDGLGAVPVARRADHPDGALQNEAAFERLFAAVASGAAVGIFPEGLSHDAAHLARLKTGAARIALEVAARHAGLVVAIVPCGLTYIHRKRFRSRVLVQLGVAVEIGPARVAAWRADEHAAVNALTAELERALRGLTVNAPDWETVRVLDGVRRLYQPPHISIEERVELARRFNEVYPRVKDDPQVVALYARVSAYLERLRAVGLEDRDLRRPVRATDVVGKLARHLMLLLVWVPLALPGAILHIPVGAFAVFAARHLTPRKDVVATTKLVAGLLALPVAYLALVGAVGWAAGWVAALAVAGFYPLSGWATVQVFDRSASVRRALVTLVRLVRLGRELAALRVERAALEAAVVEAVGRLRPPEMKPLFPRTSAPRGG